MIKKQPFGNTLKEQLIASSRDRLHSFVLADQSVRGAMVNGVRMINEMRANHELGILETMVLGQAFLAAGLLTASLKGNEAVSIKVDCSGPIKGLVAEANARGEVRGYLKQAVIPVVKPVDPNDLSSFFGAGFLTVTRYLEDAEQPFSGKIALEHGCIAKDLAHYFLISEQLPTIVNLSVRFDQQGEVVGGGGMLLQAMPGADRDMVARLADRADALPSLGLAFVKGSDPESLVREHFSGFGLEFLDDFRIEFYCRCNEKGIQQMLLSLPETDRADILANGPFPLEVRCHNCNSPYQFQREALQKMFRQ
ncbi:MAG: Hsp33 family molecular chaperone HslO [Desulfobacterales bacterium]|nr:Hsp33 family molecular chaperone HslO [Desulfobacterales bacterium]